MSKKHLNSLETSNKKSYPTSFLSTVFIDKSLFPHCFKNQKLTTAATCLFITMKSSLFLEEDNTIAGIFVLFLVIRKTNFTRVMLDLECLTK